MTRRRNLPRSFDELSGLRARGLVRESTVEQGGNSGPIVQLADEVAFANRWGLIFEQRPNSVTKEPEPWLYTDLVSGSDATKRPHFLQMIADAKARAFDVLLVRDTSRFARNHEQAVGYQAELHDAGVVVAYIVEQRLSSESAGRLQILVNHSINEEYSEKLAVNVRRGFRVKRFDNGKFSGSPPLGYVMEYQDVDVGGAKGWERRDTGKLLPDQTPRPLVGQGRTYTNAELILRVGQLYVSGNYGARSLAARLNVDGYHNHRGEPFTGNSIRKTLASPTYAGYLAWHYRPDKRLRGEVEELKQGGWEPLWPPALWDQIQSTRRRQFRGSAGGRVRVSYPFRRIAVCDRCDHKLIGEAHRDVAYMVCSTQRERHDCDQRGVKSATLEDQVGRWLATLKVPDDWREDLERMERGTRPKVPMAKDVLAPIEEQLRRLREMYLTIEISREEYVGRRRALEASLEGGAPQPTYFEADLVRVKQLLGDWAALWRAATPAERAELMAGMFSQVRVRDKAIVLATPAHAELAPLVAISEYRHMKVVGLAPPDGLEPPTQALGRLRSIH